MLETLLIGAIAQEMNTATNGATDIKRFAEICDGSPLTPVEQLALTAIATAVFSGVATEGNPVASFIGNLIGQ